MQWRALFIWPESVNEESPGYTPLVFFADFYRSKAKAHKLAGNMDLARESAEKESKSTKRSPGKNKPSKTLKR